MSKLKVAALQGLSASSDAITLANDGTCTANITNNLSNRRLTINGDMRIAQRGVSSTSSGYHTIDRFASGSGNIGQNVTQSQQSLSSSDAPYALGFRKYKRVQLAAAGNANANAYVESAIYVPEAQDLASSGWDYTSSSSKITLSFWFRCSTNQTFLLNLRTEDGSSRMFSTTFTASANNTWTKITKTISGDSNITIDSDNGAGMKIFWSAFYGTDYTDSGSTMDAWKAYSGSSQGTDMSSTWLTAGASTFDLTGVQLEVGSVATDFEHRSHGQELALCQRYYFNIEGNNDDMAGCPGYAVWHDVHWFQVIFPVPMRTTPSYTGSATAGRFYAHNSGNTFNFNQLTLKTNSNDTTHKSCQLINSSVSGGSEDGLGGELNFQADNGKLEFSAEL